MLSLPFSPNEMATGTKVGKTTENEEKNDEENMTPAEAAFTNRLMHIGNCFEVGNFGLVRVGKDNDSGPSIPLDLSNGKTRKQMNESFDELREAAKMFLEREQSDVCYELSLVEYTKERDGNEGIGSDDVQDLMYDKSVVLQSIIPHQLTLKRKMLNLVRRHNFKTWGPQQTNVVSLIKSQIGTFCSSPNCLGQCVPVEDCRESLPSHDGVIYLTERMRFAAVFPPRIYDVLKFKSKEPMPKIEQYVCDTVACLSELKTTGYCIFCVVFNQKTNAKPPTRKYHLFNVDDFNKNKYITKLFSNCNFYELKNVSSSSGSGNNSSSSDDSYDMNDDENFMEHDYSKRNDDDDDNYCDFNDEENEEDENSSEDEEDEEDFSFPIKSMEKPSDFPNRNPNSKNILDHLTLCSYNNGEYGAKYRGIKIAL